MKTFFSSKAQVDRVFGFEGMNELKAMIETLQTTPWSWYKEPEKVVKSKPRRLI